MIPRKILLMIFSLVLLASFIMPWFVKMPCNTLNFENLLPGNGIAGYEVNRYKQALGGIPAIEEIKKLTGKSIASPAYYAAFLIPAFAVACLVTALIGAGARIMGIITGSMPMVGLAALIIQFGDSVPNHMTYGAFLALAAGLCLIVTSVTS